MFIHREEVGVHGVCNLKGNTPMIRRMTWSLGLGL
jgi:hypothetical protein